MHDVYKWISQKINEGKTWECIENITEEKFNDLKDFDAIIPDFVVFSDWKKIVSEYKHTFSSIVILGIPKNNNMPISIPDYPSSCWLAYKKNLLDEMSEISTKRIENNSHWLLNQLAGKGETKKGLVMGSVQSGKTANMIGLASMAADKKWNFFIVLSGSIDNLRRQTRDRFKEELKNTDSIQWHVLDYGNGKDTLYDIRDKKEIKITDLALDSENTSQYQSRYVMVCLKQAGRLESLIKWLHGDREIASKIRLVVIDDEADQASINTCLMNVQDVEEENIDRTIINNLVVNLVANKLPPSSGGRLSDCPISSISYLSYTATPYANVLNEEPSRDSLYPNDFMISLADPEAYFGAKVIFGSKKEKEYPGLTGGNGIVRIIGDEEVRNFDKNMQKGDIPKEFDKAIKWFFCAASVMRVSGWKKPISMLIHTSPRVSYHWAEYETVIDWLKGVNKKEFVYSCKAIYLEEKEKFKKEDLRKAFANYEFIDSVADELPEFDLISEEIENLLSEISHISLNDENEDECFSYIKNGVHLCVDNSSAQRRAQGDEYLRIIYPDKKALKSMSKAPVFMIFGGNTLSRGLTIEGLVCTYFSRNVKQADTLMQMARWFGYRKGYELLQRVWLSSIVVSGFELLERLDEELKSELINYDGETLADFGPKVINTGEISKIKVTGDRRMQAAVEVGGAYSGEAFETTKFRESDLRGNISVLNSFLNTFNEMPVKSEYQPTSYVWRNVSHNKIWEFLNNYKHYDDKHQCKHNLVRKANEEGKFLSWNVAIVSVENNCETWEPYTDCVVKKSMRSKLKNEIDINIGSLINARDALIDVQASILSRDKKALYDRAVKYGHKIYETRGFIGLSDNPLLLLYKIDKNSKKNDSETRESISTTEDVVAYAIIISGDGKVSEQSYLGIRRDN